ncbi:MAG: hypothetical protein R3A48_04430 [Polyangiales bacterium]
MPHQFRREPDRRDIAEVVLVDAFEDDVGALLDLRASSFCSSTRRAAMVRLLNEYFAAM